MKIQNFKMKIQILKLYFKYKHTTTSNANQNTLGSMPIQLQKWILFEQARCFCYGLCLFSRRNQPSLSKILWLLDQSKWPSKRTLALRTNALCWSSSTFSSTLSRPSRKSLAASSTWNITCSLRSNKSKNVSGSFALRKWRSRLRPDQNSTHSHSKISTLPNNGIEWCLENVQIEWLVSYRWTISMKELF